MKRRSLLTALTLALGLAGLGLAAPAVAAPACGDTPAMARLTADLAQADGRLLVAAHRGGHLGAPENSLAAIDEAVAMGADIVELDVKVSADGVPYLMHDRTVDRTTDGQGDAEALTYAEVRRLRLKGGDTPPPTLLEALRHTCGRVLVDLDLKTARIGPVVAVVQGLGLLDQVFLFDADLEVLVAARALEPAMRVMPRVGVADRVSDIPARLGAVAVAHGDPDSLTPANQARIRALPARIWINSLGEVDRALAEGAADVCPRLGALLDRGANVIQTDQPLRLRQALAACGLEH